MFLNRFVFAFLVLVFFCTGCSTKMESENAQVIEIQFAEGSGTASGIIKAGNPGMAGMTSKNFDIQVPGKFECTGGPSEYTITFNSLPKTLERAWTVTVDGRQLKRGPDMVVEDDKGPRVTFNIGRKKTESEAK